jgi:hypothetical protein
MTDVQNTDVQESPMMRVTTIKQARDYVARGRVNGVYCPCCNKFVKAYRRKLNATMAAALVWLVKHLESTGLPVAHIPTSAPRSIVRSNQLSTLKHWGLVESVRVPSPDGQATPESGGWRPTELGIAFAQNKATISSHVVIADDQTVDADAGPQINVITALGAKYDYKTLINYKG